MLNLIKLGFVACDNFGRLVGFDEARTMLVYLIEIYDFDLGGGVPRANHRQGAFTAFPIAVAIPIALKCGH